MAKKKMKFSGVVMQFTGKAGGQTMSLGRINTKDSEEFLKLSMAGTKAKERIQFTAEYDQPGLPFEEKQEPEAKTTEPKKQQKNKGKS